MKFLPLEQLSELRLEQELEQLEKALVRQPEGWQLERAVDPPSGVYDEELLFEVSAVEWVLLPRDPAQSDV